MGINNIKNLKGNIIWWAIGVVVLLFYFLFDPLEYEWMPQCVFHKLTGLQCMGCGSQRMAHAFLHGDLAGAWNANAFVLCCIPLMVFLVCVELSRKQYPGLYKKVHSKVVIITISAMFVAWLIFRNIWGI